MAAILNGLFGVIARKNVAAAGGIVDAGSAVNGSTSSVEYASVTLPASISSGDLLVIGIAWQGTGAITVPAGWTELATATDAANIVTDFYWKIASGSEGASVTVTHPGHAPWSSSALRITGHDPTTPFDGVAATTNAGAGTVNNLPAITTATNNAMCLRLGSWATGGVEPTSESGWTNVGHSTAGTPMTLFTYKIIPTASAQAVYDFPVGFYANYVHFSTSIRPA